MKGLFVAKPQSQPSLYRSGGCLFCGLCLPGSFLHDNCDRPLLDMESYPHRYHLLLEDGDNRLRVNVQLFTVPCSGTFILLDNTALVKCLFHPAGSTKVFLLTKPLSRLIITVKSEPRTRLAPQNERLICGKATKSTVTLPEWRLSFLRALPSGKFPSQ